MRKIFVAVAALTLLTLGACQVPEVKTQAKNEQAVAAANAADSIDFTGNAEIENITNRLKLTSDPALMGYVALFNDMGQVVMYTPIKGKITSGGKRLTPPVKRWRINQPGQREDQVVLSMAPSDEGTWGSSSPYVYFWTTAGQYIQWSGNYLYSDKPFRTKSPAVELNVTNELTK